MIARQGKLGIGRRRKILVLLGGDRGRDPALALPGGGDLLRLHRWVEAGGGATGDGSDVFGLEARSSAADDDFVGALRCLRHAQHGCSTVLEVCRRGRERSTRCSGGLVRAALMQRDAMCVLANAEGAADSDEGSARRESGVDGSGKKRSPNGRRRTEREH
jgi:hypothetical protein